MLGLQSLYDTISSFMLDYDEDGYIDLCMTVWDKLAAIHSARRQSAAMFPPPHQPAVREAQGRQPPAAGYPGPSTQEQQAPSSESSNEALQQPDICAAESVAGHLCQGRHRFQPHGLHASA